ncbi:hypothetical protein Godav_006019 [Gossypium davidsonii]|uniref:Uncharacterized protein n=2 Tax=Gossypium TaxID=3633 RepID=A0A7J8S2V4_GOSDV|nr:hypothetical protein [Gossypium davidsonii]MBA0655689.1 hypothetical protein [Gossypium klotzschianum]
MIAATGDTLQDNGTVCRKILIVTCMGP